VTRRYPLGAIVRELWFLLMHHWDNLDPGVKLLRLWHGVNSMVSYLLHMISLSCSRYLLSARRIGIPRSRVRGQASISSG
jgi:hypothetical protein